MNKKFFDDFNFKINYKFTLISSQNVCKIPYVCATSSVEWRLVVEALVKHKIDILFSFLTTFFLLFEVFYGLVFEAVLL